MDHVLTSKFVFFSCSQSLTAVHFCSSSLVSLSLAGCRAVTFLELKCPYLEKVSLDGCDHLERASFCPVMVLFCVLFLFSFSARIDHAYS